MKQLLRDVFYVIVATLASLLFIPWALIFALYAACKAYRDYLGTFMEQV